MFSGTALRLLPKTGGMVYPSWYPNCQYIAADVGENEQVSGEHLTAQIDATSGVVVAAPLANNSVWAGFPSVNQVDPRPSEAMLRSGRRWRSIRRLNRRLNPSAKAYLHYERN